MGSGEPSPCVRLVEPKATFYQLTIEWLLFRNVRYMVIFEEWIQGGGVADAMGNFVRAIRRFVFLASDLKLQLLHGEAFCRDRPLEMVLSRLMPKRSFTYEWSTSRFGKTTPKVLFNLDPMLGTGLHWNVHAQGKIWRGDRHKANQFIRNKTVIGAAIAEKPLEQKFCYAKITVWM